MSYQNRRVLVILVSDLKGNIAFRKLFLAASRTGSTCGKHTAEVWHRIAYRHKIVTEYAGILETVLSSWSNSTGFL